MRETQRCTVLLCTYMFELRAVAGRPFKCHGNVCVLLFRPLLYGVLCIAA